MNKEYTLSFTVDKDGLTIDAKNNGFTGIELYGLLLWKAGDILDQIKGNVKPDRVIRTVVHTKEVEQDAPAVEKGNGSDSQQ